MDAGLSDWCRCLTVELRMQGYMCVCCMNAFVLVHNVAAIARVTEMKYFLPFLWLKAY